MDSSKTYQFPYLHVGMFDRPIIPLSLKYQRTIVKTHGLVDSGSDITIFHGDLSYLLDIDIYKLEEFKFSGAKKGDTASITGYLCSLQIGIEDNFFKTPVIFSFDIPSSGFGIVGQVGFFDKFSIEFTRKNRSVLLR